MELERIIEALLFSADRPLSTEEITKIIQKGFSVDSLPENQRKVSETCCLEAIESFKKSLEGRSVILQEIAGGWRLGTAPEYAPFVRTLCENDGHLRTPRLSQPALETLAVIAYRQPISRSEIEAVRGVAVGGVLETLIERQVVRIAGRAEAPGRPLLYETTPFFLEHFGLRSLDELPNVEELKRVKLPDPKYADSSQQPELIHEVAETTSPSEQS